MIKLKLLSFPLDEEEYVRKVKPLMKDADFVTGKELIEQTLNKEILSWWIIDNQTEKKVGWCAMKLESPYYPDAVHQYGMCIWTEYQNKGYGRAVAFELIKLYCDKTITVSIQDNSEISKRLVCEFGLEPIDREEPWQNYVLKRKHKQSQFRIGE